MNLLWGIIALLVLFWVVGLAFKVLGAFIHVLLVVALVLFVGNLFAGRRVM